MTPNFMNEKETKAYIDGFNDGLNVKDGFTYTIFGYKMNEALKILGESKMREKAKMTRAEASKIFADHMAWNKEHSDNQIDLFVKLGMLEVVEEPEVPVLEILNIPPIYGCGHVKIYANGRIEGISGTVINRMHRSK